MSLVEVYQRIPRWASRRGGRQTRRDGRDGSNLVTQVVTPAALTGLAFWARSDLGVTLVQGPVVATGTSPPAVTFSGTPSSSSNTIVLTCTAAGTNTTAAFSWTLNGVAQTPFTAAATVSLTGTGITATFPTGAYTNTPSADTYTSVVTVSQWNDQSGLGNNATQATPLLRFAYLPTSGPNSTPVMVGSNASGTFMTAAIGTLAKPCWVWVVFKLNATNNSSIIDGGSVNNTLLIEVTAATTVRLQSSTILQGTVPAVSSYAAYGATYGASGSLYVNSALQFSGTSGTVSSTGITIGNDQGLFGSADMDLAEIVICSTPPAANALQAYSQARYGFG